MDMISFIVFNISAKITKIYEMHPVFKAKSAFGKEKSITFA